MGTKLQAIKNPHEPAYTGKEEGKIEEEMTSRMRSTSI